ncbi:non-ribosomal peptide synthetase [Paenibacillus hexagrammi]|nr:non-ribosomal peptide synthetase [Paenibacillus sp. YPD9-1]
MTNLILAQREENDPVPLGSRVLQFATISFDVCYQEIFTALLSGAQLHIAWEEHKQHPERLIEFAVDCGIQTMFFPTSYLKFLASEKGLLEKLAKGHLKHLVVAGEQLVANHNLKRFVREAGVVLHNHYGPSETHVVTIASLTSPDESGRDIPDVPTIGKPIQNTRIYMLGPSGKLQPKGVPGELCIAGVCLARGYIGLPKLNAEKFVEDPFFPGERMYRTGDLARWLPDGTIEYLGRMDNQVKIRGYRIELGEIESRLLAVDGIREAAVIAKEDNTGQSHLCAYYTGDRPIRPGELRSILSHTLPSYMLPSYMIQLPLMPLNANGKVDRRALPEPDLSASLTEYKPPVTELERKIVDIWSQILGIERIGMLDHLEDLGVNSLSYMRAIVALEEEFGFEFEDGDMSAGRFVTVADVTASVEKRMRVNV